MRTWRELSGDSLDFLVAGLLPDRCAVCDTEHDLVRGVCRRCRSLALPQWSWLPSGHRVCSLFPYSGLVARSITALKYQNQPWRARGLGHLLGELVVRDAAATLLAPVPISRERGVERGYNQAARLCRHAGRAAQVAADATLLSRTRHDESQTTRGRDDRWQSDHGFVARRWTGRLLVIDDVLTTGATLTSCMESLERVRTSAQSELLACTVAYAV